MLKKFSIMIIIFLVLTIGFNNTQLVFAGSGLEGDIDQDSYTPNEGDCDDNNPFVHPGAVEIPGDGIDQDCDGIGGTVAEQVIGGEILPIHTTSLLLAGVQANYSSLTALAAVGVGASFMALKLKRK